MIKANELRLGNKFIEKSSKEVIEVIELKKEAIVFSGDFKGKWQAEPIPLTEEILLKCGFKKDKIDYTYYFGDFEILLPNYFKWKNSFIYNIKYLHQLQNLYFATTKKELEITL